MGRLAEAQRKLLEQMMGAEAMGIVQVQLHFSDEKVCKNFLCGVCPHNVFTNTKMDLGPCPRAHQEKLVIAYNQFKAEKPDDELVRRIEHEWYSNIRMFVDDCDRRIGGSQRRLEKTPEENAKTTLLMREIGEIELSIQDGTTEIEQLGEAGKVDESIQKLAAVEALREEKSAKEAELQQLADTSGASGHQKLRVCEICGAYLSILDSDRRLADHFGGKMHLGYKELRELLTKILESRNKPRAAPLAPPPSATAPPPASFSPAPPSGPAAGNGSPAVPAPSSSDRGGRERSEGRSDRDRSDRDRGSDRDRERSGRSSGYDGERDRREGSGRRGYDDDRRDSSRRYESGSSRRSRSRSPRRR